MGMRKFSNPCPFTFDKIFLKYNWGRAGRNGNNNTRTCLVFEKIKLNMLKTRLQLNQTRPIKSEAGKNSK